jgi:hypothetical protein
MRFRLVALASFCLATLWGWFWEFIRSLFYLKSDEFCSAFLRCCSGGEGRQSIAR